MEQEQWSSLAFELRLFFFLHCKIFFACFKQKLTQFWFCKCILIQEFLDIYTRKQDKSTKKILIKLH